VIFLQAQICTFEQKVSSTRDKRGVDLISGALPFGRLWYAGQNFWKKA
jgi:hypothetical protein